MPKIYQIEPSQEDLAFPPQQEDMSLEDISTLSKLPFQGSPSLSLVPCPL